MLNKKQIKELCEKGMIEPFNENNLSPASYDISLGDTISHFDFRYKSRQLYQAGEDVTTYKPKMYSQSREDNYPMKIKPGESILIQTKEKVKLPTNVGAKVFSRSSLARLGLTIDVGGWIDPGYEGYLTLLMTNLSPCTYDLRNVDRIAQLVFFECDETESYSGKYQNSVELVESLLVDDFK